MEFRTCFSSICESGYKIDAIKSGMQKYLRRREAPKMKWCANQLYKFRFGSNESEIQIGKGIFSNLINRIIVMLDEELCFDDASRYLYVYDLIKCLKNEKIYTMGVKILYEICDVLCSGHIIRLTSDICGFYFKRIFVDKEEIDETDFVLIQKEDGDNGNEGKEYDWCFKNFVECFCKKNYNVYYWLFRIFNMSNEGARLIYRRKEHIYGIWEYLEGFAQGNANLKKCWENRLKEFYNKEKSERKMFLVGVVNVFMYRDEIDFEKEIEYEETVEIDTKTMKLDDYCIDMHCSAGRNSGKNRKDFALEGCLVINEYEKYKVEEWREYYIEEKLKDQQVFKKVKPAKKAVVKEIKVVNEKKLIKEKREDKFVKLNANLEFISMNDLEFVKLCSNTTCGGKAMCFVVKYDGQLFVLKEGRETMQFNYDYAMVDQCKSIFGLNSIGMKRIKSDKIIEKVNKKEKFWENNFHFKNKPDVVYSMMQLIDGQKLIDYRRMVGEKKVDEKIWLEFMKIGLFRNIFMVSDFSQINVFIDKSGNLYSIDEHDVLGKREKIVGEKNMKIYQTFHSKIDEIFENLYQNKEEKIQFISHIMIENLFEKEEIARVLSNYETLKERFYNEYELLSK